MHLDRSDHDPAWQSDEGVRGQRQHYGLHLCQTLSMMLHPVGPLRARLRRGWATQVLAVEPRRLVPWGIMIKSRLQQLGWAHDHTICARKHDWWPATYALRAARGPDASSPVHSGKYERPVAQNEPPPPRVPRVCIIAVAVAAAAFKVADNGRLTSEKVRAAPAHARQLARPVGTIEEVNHAGPLAWPNNHRTPSLATTAPSHPCPRVCVHNTLAARSAQQVHAPWRPRCPKPRPC